MKKLHLLNFVIKSGHIFSLFLLFCPDWLTPNTDLVCFTLPPVESPVLFNAHPECPLFTLPQFVSACLLSEVKASCEALPTSTVFTLGFVQKKDPLSLLPICCLLCPSFLLLHPDWLTSIFYLVCFIFSLVFKSTLTRCHQVYHELSHSIVIILPEMVK